MGLDIPMQPHKQASEDMSQDFTRFVRDTTGFWQIGCAGLDHQVVYYYTKCLVSMRRKGHKAALRLLRA